MKVNKIEHSHRKTKLALVGLIGLLLLIGGLAIGYDKLRDLWMEQCLITDYDSQVTITSGKMVKADVIANCFGLRKGANLALIDFDKKREETLKKIPNLRSISVSRRMPNRIIIVTEEREPIARLNISGRRNDTGKVVDSEGIVFIWQRGTRLLPIIREPISHPTAVGQRLTGRARAALMMLDTCRLGDFRELNLLDADISKPDYIFSTMNGSYSRVKIAWQNMDDCTPSAKVAMERRLTMLLKAVRAGSNLGAVIWNAADLANHDRIYADTKGKLP